MERKYLFRNDLSMVKKYFLTWSLVIIIGVFFAGCERKADEKDVISIVIPVENDIQTLDPTVLSDPHTSRVVWQMYEGLVGLDDTGNPLPLIAESWEESDDYTFWTFTIRENVYFHKSDAFNNSERTRSVTAYDVQYSYMRFAEGFGSFVFSELVKGFDEYLKGEKDRISGFEVIDTMKFRVHLTRPDPSFIYRITSPYLGIIAREVVERYPQAFGRNVSIGTGPFALERRTETEVHLRRNDNYWQDGGGNVSNIIFRVEKNPQFRVTQFENNRYHIIDLPLSFIPVYLDGDQLKENKADRFSLYTADTYNVHYLGINYHSVTDRNLRRAIALGIDKNAIVESILYGRGLIAHSPVLPGTQGYHPPEGLGFEIDMARNELQRSSLSQGTLTLLVSDVAPSEQIGQVIQDQLKEIGIQIRLQKVDFNTLISRLFSQERPDLFLVFSEWVYSAPELIIDSYHSKKFPNPNVFGYKNESVDRVIDRIPLTGSREEINRLCYEAESIAHQDVPAVWLFHKKNTFLTNNNIGNFSVNAHNHWNLADVVWEN